MARKVLIIIDLQVGFVKKQTQYVPDFIQRLLEREHFDLVVQTRWENYMGSLYEEQLGYQAVGNSAETELVIKEFSDHVITRTAYSCCTDRLMRLIEKTDDIRICGLETDACVMGTLFDLWDMGFRFHVYEKGVGTNAKDLQKPALRMIERQFGKEVLI